MVKSFIISLALFTLTANSGVSQTSVSDTIPIDEVVVTGAKTKSSRKIVPFSVSQVSRKNIENSGEIKVLSALNSFAPGIFVTERNVLGYGLSTGSSGAISVRGVSGTSNTGILVLVDGSPQYQGIFGHPISDMYVSSNVEKVEIIRGPGSILYGSNAMAGVVNIITKKQQTEGLSAQAGGSYGTYNTQDYHGFVGFKKNKFSMLGSYSHNQTDGVRENTDFRSDNGLVKAEYTINDHFSVNADFNMSLLDATDNGPMHSPSLFSMDVVRGNASFALENRFEKTEGAINIYHNYGTHDLSDGWYSTDRNSGGMIYQSFNLFRDNRITVGSDFKNYGGKGNMGANANKYLTVNELAFYSYVQQTFFSKLSVSAGLRFENNSMYGNNFIPLAGFTYNPLTNTIFKGSVSKGFRSPTIMELYLFAPNPALEPERMINYEIGWLQTFFDNSISTEFTAFIAEGDNIIQTQGVRPNVTRVNIGTFSNKGVEFSARWALNKNISLHGNYSFVQMEKLLLAAPRQHINLNINYTYSILNLNVSAQHVDKLYTSFAPEMIQSFTLVNARASVKPIKNIELFVNVKNILDQKYEINYGYEMPGIHFNAGLNVSL